MANNRFELVFPDSTRRQIGCKERDFLLFSRQVKQVGPTRFKFIGQHRTFHNFKDLGEWFTLQKLSPEQIRRYLERLEVLWKLGIEQEWQSEETPEGFEQRLELMGMPTGGFQAA